MAAAAQSQELLLQGYSLVLSYRNTVKHFYHLLAAVAEERQLMASCRVDHSSLCTSTSQIQLSYKRVGMNTAKSIARWDKNGSKQVKVAAKLNYNRVTIH